MPSSPLLSARLSVDYAGRPGVLNGLELEIQPGEIVGLVGESGSGKSTLALALLRLLQFRGGSARGVIEFGGRNLIDCPERQMRAVRGRQIGLVLQSPLSALNPAMRIGSQILESWRAHREGSPDLPEVLRGVNLPGDRSFLERYPSQISVGQAQRVLIAMAILHRPALLIADEPTSALDVVTQAEILKLLARLNREMGMAVLFISHDLLSVASFCHRVAILQEGRIVETNQVAEIFRAPRHSYTRALLRAIPRVGNVFSPDSLSPERRGAGQVVSGYAIPDSQPKELPVL
jgi:ABC-type dipeptide/oligopeptide/nickel transport system ATPase component